MRMAQAIWALASAAACQHVPPASERPAVLIESTAAAQAEIAAALTSALRFAPRAVSADALTSTSWLIVEPAVLAAGRNRIATGRVLEADVQRFRLVLNGGVCSLTRPADGWRIELHAARCVPE